MKLLSVKTINLHNYITTKVIFNNELSIITGVNGSGKTSILTLIEATLKLDIKKLYNTSFDLFELRIFIENTEKTILIERTKEDNHTTLSIAVDGESFSITEPTKKNNIFGRKTHSSIRNIIDEIERRMTQESSNFSIFSKISPPMLIGLNRRIERERNKFESIKISHHSDDHLEFFDSDNKTRDSFDDALDDCKDLINNEFKRIKRYENTQLNTLRNNIITSSFIYTENFDNLVNDQTSIEKRFLEVKERKNEILETLNNIEIKGQELNLMSASFFEKLDKLYDKAFASKNKNKPEYRFTLEYLMNINQVDRIYNLVKIIDTHKSNLDEKRRKINSFESIVNSFLMDTNKRIVINSVGNIYILINSKNHKIELDELSSGEKQLVIIIANMIFSRKSDIKNIIIDEPEISLHIKWQDMFITKLREINSDIQLILATHSPDIIGKHDEYCTPIEEVI
ncbi:AAA family ATPase [Vibrio lentus]|uniref:AAA family ATPase n=1 Tax=Vibrio lentus TaxID=136468 RepID=UPI000C8320D1|nr:AAA family ATPase [Vibrio lentus]PMI39915.1 hypothetical protein BCU45_23260 [Vibrio lentus]PMI63403.1 hypothetical protein BCU40_22065 [Vibrio lentus]PMJ53580.1 hypothetical protein BCU20_24110 [Vibrio lentus]PMN00253.1 hypothetical protein BCT42_23500 [Vibrio lentus]